MADDTTRAELAQLRAQLAAQQDEVAALRRAVNAGKTRRFPRLPRRLLPFALVALLLALTPLSLLAANPFTDLVSGSVHNTNIDLIYNAGITTGCVPNAQYCPTDTVTRQEMASFLARTAGLGTNPPVVNAKTLNGVAAANYLQRNEADFATSGITSFGGALPKSTSFTSHGGRMLLFLSGSAYATTAGGTIGVRVTVDGGTSGIMQVAANEALSHKALNSIVLPVTIAAGTHTVAFTIVTGSGYYTATDLYDLYTMTVLELPITAP